MERSDSFDAWDDAGDDAGDDPLYAPAPIPAHERTWRHPSEMGQAAWMLSEPPVAIGRGLLVTTGAIGCVLGIAVLWLLVPIGNGLAPTASPTVTSSVGVRGVVTATTELPVQTVVHGDVTTTVFTGATMTLPSEDVPVNTVLVSRPATQTDDHSSDAIAVAVSVGDTPFIVTTAHAVADSDAVNIMSTGDPSSGNVLAIDGDLAYLTAPGDLGVTAFTETGSAEVGEMVMVLGTVQTPVHFVADAAVVELDAAAVREGTPVIDESGALVALCTLVQGTDGSYVALVPIAPPPVATTDTTAPPTSVDGTTTTPPVADTTTTTTIAPPVAWAGLRLGDGQPDARPVVTAVAADGPAAAAGIAVGDQLVAVDGVPVTRIDQVLAAIKAKAPGDSIVFTVTTAVADTAGATTTTTLVATTRTITVVLGVYEPTV